MSYRECWTLENGGARERTQETLGEVKTTTLGTGREMFKKQADQFGGMKFIWNRSS